MGKNKKINQIWINYSFRLFIIFFYFSQFTFLKKYFEIYLNIDVNIFLLFFFILYLITLKQFIIPKKKLVILIVFIPLIFDIINKTGSIGYVLYALKYFLLISVLLLAVSSISIKENLTWIFDFLIKFYCISFILSLPYYFDFEILKVFDTWPSDILKKDNEGFELTNLYTVTPLFSSYLSGEYGLSVFGYEFKRFSSFHIEPSNFTFFFIPMLISNWSNLNMLVRFLSILQVILSFSVTSFLIITIIFFLYVSIINKILFSIVILSIYFFLSDFPIIQLINYKLFSYSSIENTIALYNYNLVFFGGNNFNLIPFNNFTYSMNIISLFLWTISLLYLYINKFKNLNFQYIFFHSLKSFGHFIVSPFLIIFYFYED